MGGTDSKARLRTQLLRLHESEVPAEDQTFWGALFLAPCSAEDLFVMVPPTDIRRLIDSHPENLKLLMENAVSVLETYPKQLMILDESIAQSAHNAVRILTRAVPLTLESQETSGFKAYWWTDGRAVRLMNAVMRMLFMPTYTVVAPFSKATETPLSHVDASLLWRTSLNARLDTSRQLNLNRIELLKLLISLLSEPLYYQSDQIPPVPSLWRFYLTSPACPFIHNLTYSLLYTGFAFDPLGYHWVPYSTHFDRMSQEDLSEICLQTLLVLTDWSPPSLSDIPSIPDPFVQSVSTYIEEQSTSAVHSNEVARCLALLASEEELNSLYEALARVLTNVVSAESTYLPGSLKQVKFYHEGVMLLWGLLKRNKAFGAYILKRDVAQQLVVPLLFLMTENMQKKDQFGLICLCVFTLLHLSSRREFGVALNKDFREKTPAVLPLFAGTYADFLIMSLAHVITNGPPALQPLYSCMFIIMTNISPYVKALSLPASAKLMSLLDLFSLKKWLFGGASNPDIILFWLEIVNNLVQYQWAGSHNLVYHLLRKKQMLGKLLSLEVRDSAEEAKSPPPGPDASLTFHSPEEVKQSWTPSNDWLREWKSRLPMSVVQVLVDRLLPQVEEFCKQRQVRSESEVIDYIRQTSMVGILPPPHRLVMRKYEAERSSESWFSSYLWSNIYLKLKEVPLFDGQKVRLFEVKYAEREE